MAAYLLDTCALVWLANGNDRMPARIRKELAAADELYVSSVSAWEISRKLQKGTLILDDDMRTIWTNLVESYRLKVLPVTPEIAIVSTELPEIHKDPADRFIIATAKVGKLKVVTSDGRFSEYGIDVLDCG